MPQINEEMALELAQKYKVDAKVSLYLLKKSLRLVVNDRVKFCTTDGDDLIFEVEGDTGTYEILFDNKFKTIKTCNCKYQERKLAICSHMFAVLIYMDANKKSIADKIKEDINRTGPIW